MLMRSLLTRVLHILAGGRWNLRLLPIALLFIFIELHAPAALAFPYNQTIGNTIIYAEEPIAPNIGDVITRADHLLRASPINVPDIRRQIVLTNGGWRERGRRASQALF